MYNDAYGWYSTTERTFLAVSQSGTYTLTPTEVSFNGGVVTVQGNYIGDGAIITVNGIKGTLYERNNTEASFLLPKLVTLKTQEVFNLARNSTISLADKTTWADSPGWEAAFDNEHSTVYSSVNSSCNLGIDIG